MANPIISEGSSIVFILTKQCARCKQIKSADRFGKGRNKDGLKSWCKPCFSEAETVRRNANIESFRAREVQWRALNLERRRESERKANAKRRTPDYLIALTETRRERSIQYHKHRAREVTCGYCGSVYCPVIGKVSPYTFCHPCSLIRNAIRLRTKASAYKARKRNAKIEPVDPIQVFDRDRWKCKCCGIKTKLADRGTYKPKAPELDHIIPLSVGGEHSYRNTQLLCRACNLKKRNDHANDQLLMFG
jgi:5-methylcytosine-specific restriction endonuclease McrA